MKQLLLAIAFLIFFTSCNAPRDITKFVNLSEIVDAPGMSKDDLYVDINTWMAEFFASREAVVQFQDKEAGKVVGRFKHAFSDINPNLRDFVVDFDIKDESFRVTMKGSVASYERDGTEPKYFDPDRNPYYRANPDEYPLSEYLFDDMVSSVIDFLNEDKSW